MYVLDSDVLTVVSNRRNINVRKWIKGVDESDLYISIFAVMEKSKGLSRAKRKKLDNIGQFEHDLAELISLFSGRILALDVDASQEWGTMLGIREAHINDTAIAAIAKLRDFIVVTMNTKHFEGRGVKLLDPSRSSPAVIVA